MVTFSEAQVLAWISPWLWPFFRMLGLFMASPVLSMRSIPMRVKVMLALLVTIAAEPSLPAVTTVTLNSPQALMTVAHQVLVGLTIGFAARVVFAAVEYAGEVVGLQMGLNFASFFDPVSATQATAVSRFYGTCAAWLFVVMNGHLMLTAAVIHSFQVFPVSDQPMAVIRALQPAQWGAEVFRLGLWVSLPIVVMLTLVNLVMGLIARIAPQMNVFSVGFPITIGVGLTGLWLTLPAMEQPITAALERALSQF